MTQKSPKNHSILGQKMSQKSVFLMGKSSFSLKLTQIDQKVIKNRLKIGDQKQVII